MASVLCWCFFEALGHLASKRRDFERDGSIEDDQDRGA